MDSKPATLSEMLVAKGVVNLAQLRAAQETRRMAGGEVADIVVQLGYTTEEQVARCRAEMLDVPYIDLTRIVMDTQLMQAVPKMYLFKFCAMPIEVRGDGKLLLVVANPGNSLPVIRRFEDALHLPVALGISTKTAIVERLTRLFGPDFSVG